jgi:hypothetical protein
MADEITAVLEGTSLNLNPRRVISDRSRKTSGKIRNIQAKARRSQKTKEKNFLDYPGVKPFEGREYYVPCQSDKTGKDKRIAICNCWLAGVVNCKNGKNGDYLVLPKETEGT